MAKIGTEIARVLARVHELGVVHRDVSPQNIVLHAEGERVRPVLIDFGLARVLSRPNLTPMQGPYVAPEAQCDKPGWEAPADVWALACSLRDLVDAKGKTKLTTALGNCFSRDVKARPSAQELAQNLSKLSDELHVEDSLRTQWGLIYEWTSLDRREVWFWSVLEKHREVCQMLLMGLWSDPYDRAGQIAFIIDQTLERWSRHGGRQGVIDERGQRRALSLGKVAAGFGSDLLPAGITIRNEPSIKFLSVCRRELAHGDGQRTWNRGAAEIRQLVTDGAKLVGVVTGLKSLERLALNLFGPS